MREFIAEIVERKFEPVADDVCIRDGLRNIRGRAPPFRAPASGMPRCSSSPAAALPASTSEVWWRMVVNSVEDFAVVFPWRSGRRWWLQQAGRSERLRSSSDWLRHSSSRSDGAAVRRRDCRGRRSPPTGQRLTRRSRRRARAPPPAALHRRRSGRSSPAENSSRSSSVAAPSAFVASRILKRVMSWQRFR